MKNCSKCKRLTLEDIETHNSVSRRDNSTYVCNNCGLAEALADHYGGTDAEWISGKNVK